MTTIWAGLSIGAIYAIVALGYNIVWVGAGVFNFAQAHMLMVGTFAAYVGAHDLGLPVAAVPLVGIGVGLVLGMVTERVALAPVAGRGGQAELVTTLAVAIILGGVAGQIWGAEPRTVPFFGSNAIVTVLGGRIAPSDISTIVAALVAALLLALVKRKTLVGVAAVAASEDRTAAMLRGVNVKLLAIGAVALGGAFLGAFGLLVAQRTYAVSNLGDLLAIKAFVVMAIGGFGSEIGAIIGGFTIGLIEALSLRYLNSSYANVLVFATLLIVLLARPSGLFVSHRTRTV